MTDKYIKEFKEIVQKEWYALTYPGDSVKAKDGGMYTVLNREEVGSKRWSNVIQVVVEFPDGRLFAWSYDEGATEYQENEYPWDFYGENWKPTEVEHYTETIVVDKFIAKENSDR